MEENSQTHIVNEHSAEAVGIFTTWQQTVEQLSVCEIVSHVAIVGLFLHLQVNLL